MPIEATFPEDTTDTIAPGETETGEPTSPVMLDTLGRRKKLGDLEPGKPFRLLPVDYNIWAHLNRFGPRSSKQMFDEIRPVPWYTHFNERLTKLRHGYITLTGEHITYISTPSWQGKNMYRHHIYDLTPYSITALENGNTKLDIGPVHYIKRKSEHPIHRFMGASVLSSIAIYIENALRLHYIDQNEILAHENTPRARLMEDYPFSIPVGDIQIDPDEFFAVQDPLNTRKAPSFHPVEIDRTKETIKPDKARNSVGGKMMKYDEAIERGTFETHLGIPNRRVYPTFITNNWRHKRNMQGWCREHIKHHDRFCFAAVEGFQTDYWEIPGLIHIKFETADGAPVELG